MNVLGKLTRNDDGLTWEPMKEEKTEMNETIKIDGKDYEVLTLDRIGEITHAKLAGGKVVGAKKCDPYIRVGVPHSHLAGRWE